MFGVKRVPAIAQCVQSGEQSLANKKTLRTNQPAAGRFLRAKVFRKGCFYTFVDHFVVIQKVELLSSNSLAILSKTLVERSDE